MNGHVAAGVVTSNYAFDIGGLNNLLKEWGSRLSDEFTQYVLESTVGDHDYHAENIKKSPSLKSSLFKQLEFKQPHLSAKDVNVYSNGLEDGMLVAESGVQLTDSPLDGTSREYSNIRIRSTSDVQVTVVDEYDNEWPEVEKGELQPNWEVEMSLTGTFADYTNYSPAVVSEWFQKWIPVTVSPDGTVNFDYYLESDFSGSGQIEDIPNHIWGTGTFEDDKQIINGKWATKQTIVINKGAVDERSDVLTVDGEFTLAGHFIGGFFFSDGDESHATANATHVSTWVDPDYRDSETHTGTNMTPEMSIDDFRLK